MEAFDLYYKYGKADYIGENISQDSHAIQCAMQAEHDFPENREFIIACFLHDIGHLIALQNNLDQNNLGCIRHENVGEKYLKEQGFPELVYQCCKYHPKAKRYLVSIDRDYYNNLSEASKQTLVRQGGKMDGYEMRNFELHPNFKYFIKMRYYDDKAKDDSQNMKDKLAGKDYINHYKNEFLKIDK